MSKRVRVCVAAAMLLVFGLGGLGGALAPLAHETSSQLAVAGCPTGRSPVHPTQTQAYRYYNRGCGCRYCVPNYLQGDSKLLGRFG